MGKCEKKFVTDDKTLTCDKDGKHIVHKDGDTTFTRAPGGAIVNDRKK